MKFPIVLFKENDSALYFFNESDFGLVSSGGEKFYSKGVIYDSDGSKFFLVEIESLKKANFFTSIKYFQQMYLVKVKYKFEEKITLQDFKECVLIHIKKHSRYWIKKDPIKDIEKEIMIKNTFIDIITYLR